MQYEELFGIRKLKCPKCNNTQMFYVGSYPEDFSENFSIEERTCENCKKHVWNSDKHTVLTDGWSSEEIVEAISGEFENQNKHSQTNYPSILLKTLRTYDIPEHKIQDILIDFFKAILD